jgi:hypothetical protein
MIHIEKFIERVQGFDARATKDFTMSMKDAKSLHADITRLLLTMEVLREHAVATPTQEVIQLEVGGGSFK